MPSYMVEMLVEDKVVSTHTDESQAVEILVGGKVYSEVVEDNLSIEVFEDLRDTHYYIGPTAPTDPSILVWYDTSAPL